MTYHMGVLPPRHSDAFCVVGGSRLLTTPPMVNRSQSKRRPLAAPSHPTAARPVSVLLQFQRGNTQDPVIIIVDSNNDADDNGITLSGVSIIC